MMTDCVVVGAGPAGLAASVALTQQGVDQLLGGQGRYAYADRTEIVQKLEELADNLPVHLGTRVARLAAAGDGYAVGLTWLNQRGSGIFFGFPTDAAAVADAVKARLNGS
jgi:predicted NAD/FAD-dependent oxidoreductase